MVRGIEESIAPKPPVSEQPEWERLLRSVIEEHEQFRFAPLTDRLIDRIRDYLEEQQCTNTASQ